MSTGESPRAAPPGWDRRQHPRVTLLTQVEAIGSHDVVVGESHDVGEGGLSVTVPKTFECGSDVVVRFYLPPFPPGFFAEIDGAVVWAIASHSMGIQFKQLSDGTRDAILKFVTLGGSITEKGLL
jgi:hypothetical protein